MSAGAIPLALWLGVLPLLSALHLAMVPHVFCPEHRHLHEVVVPDRQAARAPYRATDSTYSRESPFGLAQLRECPFLDPGLRLGVAPWQCLLPQNPLDSEHRTGYPYRGPGSSRTVLTRAPKHSPPSPSA